MFHWKTPFGEDRVWPHIERIKRESRYEAEHGTQHEEL
jgi:hypothetical protein